MRQQGYFDPEVLALAYLLMALVRGNFLKASVVTWLSTFGRHLIEVPPTGVEVSPREVAATGNRAARLELVVGPDTEAPDQMRLLGALQGVLKHAMSGGGALVSWSRGYQGHTTNIYRGTIAPGAWSYDETCL